MAEATISETALGAGCELEAVASVNYARRQQYRRLSHVGKAGLGSVIAALFGLVAASAGALALAELLLLAAVGLGMYARHWLSLASRSRVGARSEDEVQRALAPLERRGGGFGTRCHGKARETSTRWRSRPPASPSRSRLRPGRTTVAISLGCVNRRHVSRGAGEDGRETVPSQSRAMSGCGASSGSSTTSLWCPSTG
jgi:hypothetical protein